MFLFFEEWEQGITEGGITRNRSRTKQELLGKSLMSTLLCVTLVVRSCIRTNESREDIGNQIGGCKHTVKNFKDRFREASYPSQRSPFIPFLSIPCFSSS